MSSLPWTPGPRPRGPSSSLRGWGRLSAAGLRPPGGAAAPLSREQPSQPGGCFSPSRALSSRPHIRVWSAAAAVSAGAGASGAGPGRSKWRRREAERRPRSAQSPRNFRLEAPQLSGKCRRSGGGGGRGRKGEPRREVWGEAAESRGDSNPRRGRWRSPPVPRAAAAPASFPRALPAAAEPEPEPRRARDCAGPRRRRRAEPSRAPSSRPPGPVARAPPARVRPGLGLPRGFAGRGGSRAAHSPRRPGVVGPGSGCCMRGGAAVSRRRRWKA